MNTRTFALIFGVVFLIVGVAGFIPGLVQPPHGTHDLSMDQNYGDLFGLFPVNLLHNVVHIVFGLWGLAASRSLGGSIGYARAVAIIYALLTVLGLLDATNTTFGFVPIYGNDVWLHAALALVAAYFGWMHRGSGTADRI